MGEPRQVKRRGKKAATAAPEPAALAKQSQPEAGHAGKAEQLSRLETIYEWIVTAKTTAWKYAQAKLLWGIEDRQYRRLEQRVLEEMRLSRKGQRPFDHEVAVARLERLIELSFEKHDREEARRATFTLHRITAGVGATGGDPPPPPAAGTQVNIGKIIIDLRGSSPIEKQRRLAELDARRAQLLGPGPPPRDLDPTQSDEAGDGDGQPEQDER